MNWPQVIVVVLVLDTAIGSYVSGIYDSYFAPKWIQWSLGLWLVANSTALFFFLSSGGVK